MSQSPLHFNHVRLHALNHQKEILKKVASVIEGGWFFNGQQTKLLEKRLQEYLGWGYLTTVTSGHDALSLALSCLKLSPDDEIIFPVNVFPTAFPICLSLSKPVPVDCDANGQINFEDLLKKITGKTKAIILVHLYGLVGQLGRVLNSLKGKNITLIEDCAQAFGSKYRNRPVGTWGDIACFSFYPTKNLGGFGEGGAIWTKHKKYHHYFLKAKSYGEKRRYFSNFIAGHSRLSEIQAGILNVYSRHLKSDDKRRKNLAYYYKSRLTKPTLANYLRVLESDSDSDPVPHLFVVEAKKRDALKKFLQKKNIETNIHYPYPIHLLPAFSFLGYQKGDFPQAERLAKNILSLPFHQYLNLKQIDFITQNIIDFYYG